MFSAQPICAAIIARVLDGNDAGHVNLAVFDGNGVAVSRLKVPLIQDGQTAPQDGDWCEWMPYQKGQAAKTEALERRLGGA
jgi:hypothetical protein